jgi:hypothetical protein
MIVADLPCRRLDSPPRKEQPHDHRAPERSGAAAAEDQIADGADLAGIKKWRESGPRFTTNPTFDAQRRITDQGLL